MPRRSITNEMGCRFTRNVRGDIFNRRTDRGLSSDVRDTVLDMVIYRDEEESIMRKLLLVLVLVLVVILGLYDIMNSRPTTQVLEVTREVTAVPSGTDDMVATFRSVIQTEVAVCCSECEPCEPSVVPSVSTTPTATRHYPTSTRKVTETIRPSDTPVSTPTLVTPTLTIWPTPTATPTLFLCYQWVCHKPGTAAEQDYCCESMGCVDAHLGHGDYLGKCREKTRLSKAR